MSAPSREVFERYKVKFEGKAKTKRATKKKAIKIMHKNYPNLTAIKIARHLNTTTSYVYNVWNDGEIQRGRINRIERSGEVHGLVWFEDRITEGMYDMLEAPVLNSKTGMKQVGFKDAGDPCSCQVHRNGRAIVWPHRVGWRSWLLSEFVCRGWSKEISELVVNNLYLQASEFHGCCRVRKGFLPENFGVETDFGVEVTKDSTPFQRKETLEMTLKIPEMKRFLGLPELRKQHDHLIQGTMTTEQVLRALVGVASQNSKSLYRLEHEIKRLNRPGEKEGPKHVINVEIAGKTLFKECS